MSSLWCSAGSEMEFSTKTLIVCCGEGKMCLHAWILGFKRKCCLQKCMTFLPHSRFHTLALAHTSLLSAHCMMGGESGKSDGGSSHWRAYSSWVIGSSWGGLSSVVNSRRCRGDRDGLNKGGIFFTMREGQRRHWQSHIFSITHQPTPVPLNYPQKLYYRYSELLKRQVTWRQALR